MRRRELLPLICFVLHMLYIFNLGMWLHKARYHTVDITHTNHAHMLTRPVLFSLRMFIFFILFILKMDYIIPYATSMRVTW